MSNGINEAEVAAEFNELFGLTGNEEEEVVEEQTEEEPVEDEGEETSEEEERSEEEEPSEERTVEDKKKHKQNNAFAELRTKNTKNEKFIRNLGKSLGLADSVSADDIMGKVNELMMNKQAKEQGIPLETLQRIQQLESLVQENQSIKLEKQVSDAFSNLSTKYGLEEGQLNEFAGYLMENNKNPLIDAGVDIEAEYLKLHFEDITKKAVEDALAQERARKENIANHGSSGTPGAKGEQSKETEQINSVADLNKFFDSLGSN